MILRTPRYSKHAFYCLLIAFYMFIQNIRTAESRAVSPKEERARRLTREVYPEEVTSKQAKVCIFGDVVYGPGEAVVSPDPCQQCECQPPGVECNPVKCPPPSPGCKALHRPDKCCPSYQCECTIGNRTYANGERLEENPKGPCKVCYCRGGEIQCADVGCYRRDDCEPVSVEGQCCPKYDNCPPRDRASSTIEPISLETVELNQPSDNSSSSEQIGLFESGPQIMSFEDVNPSSESPASASVEEPSSEKFKNPKDSQLKITEVVIPPKREINFATNYNSEETEPKEKRLLDSKEELSTAGYEHPPSVIKVGNSVIILDKGEIKSGQDLSSTPSPIIHVIGAEGLQIGGVDEFHVTETTEVTSEKIEVSSENVELEGPTKIPFLITEDVNETLLMDEVPGVIPLKHVEDVETSERNPAYPPLPDEDLISDDDTDDKSDSKILLSPSVVEALNSNLNETDTNRRGPDGPALPIDWLKDNNTESDETTTELTTNRSKESIEDSGEQVTEGLKLAAFASDEDASVQETHINDEIEFVPTEESDVNLSQESTDSSSERLSSQEISTSDSLTTFASILIEEITNSNEHSRSSQEYDLLNRVSDEIAKFKLHESNNNFDNVLNIMKDFLDKQAKSGFR